MIVKDKDNTTQIMSKSTFAPVTARGSGEAAFNLMNSMGALTVPLAPPPSYGTVQNPFYGLRVGAEPARRRFCRAFAVAIIVWVLLTLFVRSIIDMHFIRRRHQHGSLARDYPEFSNGEVFQCVERPDWQASSDLSNLGGTIKEDHLPPLHSSTSFILPPGAENLYFLSRGALARGSVIIKVDDDPTAGDGTVKVDVDIWYYFSDALDRASVCALKTHGDDGRYGVGIFTPQRWPGRPKQDRLYFGVTIHLPLGVYKSLETDYGNFALRAADLQGSVVFEELRLKTSNGLVHADSLEALRGTVKSSNGPITGKYNVTDSLELVTSNSPIEATVDLYSENSRTPSLLLKTSNGHIDSDLRLHGEPVSSAFDIEARTSNAPALIQVTEHPHTAPLTLEVHTSNSPARVALQPAFEGLFTLHTSSFAPPVLRAGQEGIEDPSGQGRNRSVEVSKQVRGTLEGKVWWGDWARKDKGWVHVTSSNSLVELDLTGHPSW